VNFGGVASGTRCTFFLTIEAKSLIKEAQPHAFMSGAEFDVKGESIDEERNEEESARQEEKEVAEAAR